jgi:hypothetical protein
MRSVPVLATVALGAIVLASGCGQQHQGTSAGLCVPRIPSAALTSRVALPVVRP